MALWIERKVWAFVWKREERTEGLGWNPSLC